MPDAFQNPIAVPLYKAGTGVHVTTGGGTEELQTVTHNLGTLNYRAFATYIVAGTGRILMEVNSKALNTVTFRLVLLNAIYPAGSSISFDWLVIQ